MATEEKKMSQSFDAATGTLKFSFPGLEPLSYAISEFPENVRAFWTGFGMKTAGRNASIGSKDDGSVGTPAEMRERVAAKFEQWKAGILRAVSSGEEKAAVPGVILEAAAIYKQMKAAIAAGADIDDWANFPVGMELAELRKEVESWDDFVTNPEAVEKAKDEARAAGKDEAEVEAAGEKAAVTRLDVAKANKQFKYALEAAKQARADKKKAALKAAMVAEAAQG